MVLEEKKKNKKNAPKKAPKKPSKKKTEANQPNQEIVEKADKKAKKQKRKVGFYYSFLTIVLLFCLIQIGFGVILNISKTISYKAKINTLQKIKDDAQKQNEVLKQEIKMFSSNDILEGIARNNLKMAGEDEVLIIINENTQPVQEEEKQKAKKE